MSSSQRQNSNMVNDDLPFVIIGVVLGGLVVGICILLGYYWIKKHKNQHLKKRYEIKPNLYTKHKPAGRSKQTVATCSNAVVVEPVYLTVESFRRQNRSSGTDHSVPGEYLPSTIQNVSDRERSSSHDGDINENAQQPSSIVTSQPSSPSQTPAATPPPLPTRKYSNEEVRRFVTLYRFCADPLARSIFYEQK